MTDLDFAYWMLLLHAFRSRSRALAEIPQVRSVLCFKNHGSIGGASIPHPHSQVIGMPIVPSQQLKLLGATQRYFNEHKSCLLCDYAKYERSSGLRVVDERDNYIAVIPFAASIPYHTKIIPLSHNAHFSEATDQDLAGAAEMLSTVCSRLACLMKNADFNVVLRTAPVPGGALSSQTADDYHWHIEFYPRLDSWPVAGFEFGTGNMTAATRLGNEFVAI
eukprot:GHVU01232038.1.p1 GENE.GHVU01232038.1~~GHVU01232038.1.p1  ORF type:complete len:244 (-),score=51.51 GHVU01232038.1:629-1288(-)